MTDTEARRTGPRRWRGQEPEDRRAARRTQLIEAGLQIMGTEGAAAATMRATCREAALTAEIQSYQTTMAMAATTPRSVRSLSTMLPGSPNR